MPVPNDYWPPFSPGEYARRHRLIRDLLARLGLDALVIYGTHHTPFTDPGQINITWAAGYAGFFHSYLVFPAAGEPSLVIPLGPWHLDNARELSAIPDVRGGVDVVAIVIERLRELRLTRGRLGIVGTMEWIDQSIPWRHHERLRAALPEASLELVSKAYEELRVVKSPEELAVTERAAGIADEAHEVLNRAARPGVTNTDLFNAVLAVVHERGARINMCHLGSTSTLNPDMFYADPLPVNRPLQAGDVILTELCAGVAGYFAKIWGCTFVGEPTREYRRMFELAATSYRQLREAVRPGGTGKDLAPYFADAIEAAGYRSGSAIGGWGTYNQPPAIGKRARELTGADWRFEPGQTFTIMGWPISRDERQGVWAGDTCVVTETGCRSLHRYPVAEIQVV